MITTFAKNIFYALYSGYAACIFLLACLLIFVPGALVLPKLSWRRQAGRLTVQLFTLLCGIRLDVSGLEKIPQGGCVVVANHCSYLDGPLLAAVLPARFSLVIKREAAKIPLVGFFLGRIQHILVERSKARQAAEDAQRIIDRMAAGEAVGIFAEGTFRATPGVHRFKPSAFVGACRHQIPVVPVAISGTRILWPDKRRSLRPCQVDITILAPINTADYGDRSERQQARAVAEATRDVIAATVGEPKV